MLRRTCHRAWASASRWLALLAVVIAVAAPLFRGSFESCAAPGASVQTLQRVWHLKNSDTCGGPVAFRPPQTSRSPVDPFPDQAPVPNHSDCCSFCCTAFLAAAPLDPPDEFSEYVSAISRVVFVVNGAYVHAVDRPRPARGPPGKMRPMV